MDLGYLARQTQRAGILYARAPFGPRASGLVRATAPFRDHTLERGPGGRPRFVARSDRRARAVVPRLLVSALCLCSQKSPGFDSGILRAVVGEKLSQRSRPPQRKV